ncbi:putative RNA-dependent RNA polymerase 5 [Bidens hawaiensis]|uniref:putative RNA-dependent RNA polymerase 5 n=1 Tax=Bidens hawaiensis TaxID=980011 RepID=UPI00404A0D55
MNEVEVTLPLSVNQLIKEICVQKLLPMPDVAARKSLSKISEESAVDVLKRISSTSTSIYNLSGFIVYMVKQYGHSTSAQTIRLSSSSSTNCTTPQRNAALLYQSPTLEKFFESPCFNKSPANTTHSGLSCSSLRDEIPAYGPPVSHSVSPGSSSKGTNGNNQVDQNYYGSQRASDCGSPVQTKLFTPFGSPTRTYKISPQSLILAELEFRKLFMLHSYIGRNKLDDCVSVEDAIEINSLKSLQMFDFEDWMWRKFGSRNCQLSDRAMYLDWDSGKTHFYYCYVSSDGSYQFKGPCLDNRKTHLQRELGDENVLIVKFAEAADMMTWRNYEVIAEAGILVGLTCYRFFVFKDEGKERQTKGKEYKKRGSSVKCYFVKRESIAPCNDRDTFLTSYKTTHDVRCLFMHLHTVSTIAKYNARLSLILSTTIKLQVDLASVTVEEIEDIPCMNEKGFTVCDEDGEPLIQTDGTGFISEDLAVLVPNDFHNAKYPKDKDYEKFDLIQPETVTAGLVREAPLLIQCRLFHEGSAVKGTLLVNKKLKPRTIQVRTSMIKVRKDPKLSDMESFNSIEIVSVSHRPYEVKLSKNLIALLTIGGVPNEYFLDLLSSTLKELQRVSFDPRAAFRIASIYKNIDDSGICMEMFGARIPLTEPFFQRRLSQLAKEERKGLGEGKIPLTESFYLYGTADPTGILNSDEVCVILENGQISGKVLVYRNPALHFGDVHVLNARYVKELEDYIGNCKFGIFFSTKGKRSVANEIGNGDFDGDMYWVSRNPQLLHYFKPCKPWTRIYSTPSAPSKKLSELTSEELESELFRLLFSKRTHSSAAGTAAHSWMAFMDRYLILQDGDNEKDAIKNKMLHLIDLYYDALDAAKSGKKVEIPNNLKATRYPHHMGRKPEYHSTSILGKIFDEFQNSKNEKLPMQEIWKLPQFNVNIPDSCLIIWDERYQTYRQEMAHALTKNDQSKKDACSRVITKYKQMLYGALDFKDSTRNIEDVYNEALAIYHITYDFAKSQKDVGKCGFAWKVAGSALCAYHRKIHCMNTGEREITFLSSSFDGIF